MTRPELNYPGITRVLPLPPRLTRQLAPPKGRKRGLLALLGPGLITGASDDDPSGIATYSQAGAQFGYSMTWVMLFSFPLIAAIQEVCARIGRVTGKGIAGNIRRHYSPWLLRAIVLLLLAANTINLGAELGAMGEELRLLAVPRISMSLPSLWAVCCSRSSPATPRYVDLRLANPSPRNPRCFSGSPRLMRVKANLASTPNG
jgi:Natural resistance-associated macrophage protein